MSPIQMGLQRGLLGSFPIVQQACCMSPSFPHHFGAEQLPQLSTHTIGCPHHLSPTLLRILHCLEASQMSPGSGCLVLLPMCTFRGISVRASVLTWRSVCLLDIQLSSKVGSSTTLQLANLWFLTELTLMRGSVLVQVVICLIKLSFPPFPPLLAFPLPLHL